MAVTAADLTIPPTGTGELHPEWFADGALPGLLAVWIAAGVQQVPVGTATGQADRITLSYAYWLAYGDKVLSMAASPNSVSVDKGDISVSFAADQRKIFSARRDYWLGEFSSAVTEVVTVTVVDTPPRASYAQAIVRSF